LVQNLVCANNTQLRFIENLSVIKIIGIITDILWSSPAYHGISRLCKIWCLVIIIEHRCYFSTWYLHDRRRDHQCITPSSPAWKRRAFTGQVERLVRQDAM